MSIKSKSKGDLIGKIAQDTGITKKKAQQVVDSFLDGISEGLTNSGKITLTNFGSFKVKEQSARTGRNPQSGEKITISARRVVKFSPGKGLRNIVA